MESASTSHCEVCDEEYRSLETSPKCLSCGHIFCSSCVANLTSNQIKCPTCHSTISMLTAEDIDTVNENLKTGSQCSLSKDIMEKIKNQRSSSLTSVEEQRSTARQRARVRSLDLSAPAFTSINSAHRRQIRLASDSQESDLVNRFTNDCSNLSLNVVHRATESHEELNRRSSHGHVNDFGEDARSRKESGSSSDSPELHDLINKSQSPDPSGDNEITPREPNLQMSRESPSMGNIITKVDTQGLNKDFSDTGSESVQSSLAVHRRGSIDLSQLRVTPDIPKESIFIEENFVEIKEIEMQRFTDQLQILHEVMETVDDAILTLQVEKEQQEKTKLNLQTMILEEEKKIEASGLKIEEAAENKVSIQKVTDALKDQEEKLARTGNLDSLEDALKESYDVLVSSEELGTTVELYYMQLLLSRNVPKPEYLERMLDLGENIRGEHLVEGETRWAEISMTENKLHVHALDPIKPTQNCRMLPFSCLRNMISKENAMTFMDISVAGKKEGRIYFSMFGDTARAQQFVTLCSGEHKYSYRKTKMKQLGNPEQPAEYISFHGPKNARGSPIRGVIPGITQGGVYTRRKTQGLLAGAALSHRQRTLFIVYLEPDLDEDTTGAFGEVIEGLEILRKVSKHEPVHEVVVEDCGLVIPLISLTD